MLADAISLNLRDEVVRQRIFDSYGPGLVGGNPLDARRAGVEAGIDFVDSEPVSVMFEHVDALLYARDGRRVVFNPKTNRRNQTPPNPIKNPDYTVDGEFVDAFMPTASKPVDGVVLDGLRKQFRDGQTQRVDIILDRNPDGSLVDDLVEFGRSCKVAASFGAATLVVMADGSRRRIDTISVGDQVLAWDIDAGTTVAETVTATLPHTDTLYTAEFSDGSHVQVTEDHVFYNATADAWMELHYVQPGDQLLSPDGYTVTLVGLDWDPTFDAAAYDLSVSDEHNYFITANHASEPVLVHNMTQGSFCGVRVDSGLAPRLLETQGLVDFPGLVGQSLQGLAGTEQARLLELLAASADGSPALAARMADNLRHSDEANALIAQVEESLVGTANYLVFSQRTLGDPAYDDLWTTLSDGARNEFLDLLRSGTTGFPPGSPEELVANAISGRSVVANPLEGVRAFQTSGPRRGDAFVDGLITDFKAIRFDDVDRVFTNLRSWFRTSDGQGGFIVNPQGDAVILRVPDGSESFTPAAVNGKIDNFLTNVAGSDASRIARIEVLLEDGTSIVRLPPFG